MLNPCANSKLKRRRAEKQTPNLTIGNDEGKDVKNEEIASSDGLLSTPIFHSAENVRSPAIFILDSASLKKGLVKKNWKILNSDEDAKFLLRQKKNLNDYRPDIIHEVVELLQESSVRAKNTNEVLLRVVEEPMTPFAYQFSHSRCAQW
ncbi:hypothetical protein L6164_037406 [Bauhinia variegata]|uniref:Uncharacterized protein n=1 Tax=Bauhinia variegata TaxID=167791 RepID=A0ACB9KK10_BAUVA|nr:hypothetical protein L6164_037406 [Bauhinia variegata]